MKHFGFQFLSKEFPTEVPIPLVKFKKLAYNTQIIIVQDIETPIFMGRP